MENKMAGIKFPVKPANKKLFQCSFFTSCLCFKKTGMKKINAAKIRNAPTCGEL